MATMTATADTDTIEEELRENGHITVKLGNEWGGGPSVSASVYQDRGFHVHIMVMRRGEHVLDAEAESYAAAAQKASYYINKYQ